MGHPVRLMQAIDKIPRINELRVIFGNLTQCSIMAGLLDRGGIKKKE